MALGASNRVKIRYILETLFGVTPASGNPNDLRMTGESLDFNINTVKSAEIRSDRQITDLVPVGADAQGGLNVELSYQEYDKMIEAVLQGTWDPFGTNGVGAVIPTSATFAASTLTAGAATSGLNIFTKLVRGQWVKFAGSTIPAQNKLVQISRTISPTTTVITFEGTPFATALGNGGAAVTLSSSRLVNGVTERSFTIEREHNDLAQFFAFRGMSANKLSLSFASGALVNGSIEFMGKDAVRSGVTSLPGTSVASKTYDITNAVSGVGNVLENGVPLTNTFIKSVKLDIMNNLRARDGIGVLGAVSIGSGEFDVQGTLEIYLADGTLYDKFINNQSTSLQFSVQDGSGNGYAFNVPKLKFRNAKVNAGSKDQDVMLSVPFDGLLDPVTGSMLIIDRFGVV
jgi:hypothetical protein